MFNSDFHFHWKIVIQSLSYESVLHVCAIWWCCSISNCYMTFTETKREVIISCKKVRHKLRCVRTIVKNVWLNHKPGCMETDSDSSTQKHKRIELSFKTRDRIPASKVKFSSQIRSANHQASLDWNVTCITDFRIKSLVPNYDQTRCGFRKTCTKFMASPKEREHMK